MRSPGSIRDSCVKTARVAAVRTVHSRRLAYARKLAFLTGNPYHWRMRSPRREIDSPSAHWLVRRIRSVIALGLFAAVALFTFISPDQPEGFRLSLGAAVFLFCAWGIYRPVLRYVGSERQRLATLAEAARLDGATLATRTVRHHLSNTLAVAVGYSELLVDDPRLPHELEEQARKIMASALAAVETVDKLQERIARVQMDTTLAGPPLLDLDASTAVHPPSRI
jgi:signal transduction histidine kinase